MLGDAAGKILNFRTYVPKLQHGDVMGPVQLRIDYEFFSPIKVIASHLENKYNTSVVYLLHLLVRASQVYLRSGTYILPIHILKPLM